MALTPAKYIDESGVRTLATGIKTWALSENSALIKSVIFKDNSILFYNKPNATAEDAADFTVDLPAEFFLDQTKTVFVPNFAWSAETYPASTDPSLDGQPVLVLAVKGDNSITYSFVSLGDIVATIIGEATSTATTTVSDGKAKVDVKISSEADNALEAKTDGLYVNIPSAEVSISSESGNSIVKKTDGLYVSVPEITVATDEEVSALFS